MTDCKELIAQLPEVPESSQRVLCLLNGHDPMTAKEIREALDLPRRTLYTALSRLREAGVLKERVSLRDSRQRFFWIDPDFTNPWHNELHFDEWATAAS